MLEELMEVHDNLEEVGDVEIVEEHVVDDEQEIVVVDDKIVVALKRKDQFQFQFSRKLPLDGDFKNLNIRN